MNNIILNVWIFELIIWSFFVWGQGLILFMTLYENNNLILKEMLKRDEEAYKKFQKEIKYGSITMLLLAIISYFLFK